MLSAAVAMTAFGLVVGAASYIIVSQVARSSADEILAASTEKLRDQVVVDAQVRHAQSAVLLALVIVLPLVIGGVCLAVWLSVGRALRAVDDLTTQAKELQTGTDRTLVVQSTGDEVERLGRTLNDLLEHLDQQTQSTRQFVADAGHELRNPLTTLRVALEFGEGGSPGELRTSMAEALAELNRLERLVQDLLALARTDAMDSGRHFDVVELDELVAHAVDSLHRSRPDVDVVVEVDPCRIQGDVGALRGLVTNLLDNAARHAVSRIDVRLRADARTATLTVDDDGRGLLPEDCERVFRRFVRLDEARVRDEGGSGLGLAIVASAAAAHDGEASARPGPGGHFEVTIARSLASRP